MVFLRLFCILLFGSFFFMCISGQLQNTRIRVVTGRNLHCSYGLSNPAAADRLLVTTPAAGRALQLCCPPTGGNIVTLSRTVSHGWYSPWDRAGKLLPPVPLLPA